VNDAGADQCHQCGAAFDAPLAGVRTDVPREHGMGSDDGREGNGNVSVVPDDERVTAHVPESLAESLERIRAELRQVELAKSAGTGRVDALFVRPEDAVSRGVTQSRASGGAASMDDSRLRISDGAVIAFNDNWQTAPNAGELQSSGFAPSHPLESAVLITLNPGLYTAIVSGVNNTSGTGIVEVYAR